MDNTKGGNVISIQCKYTCAKRLLAITARMWGGFPHFNSISSNDGSISSSDGNISTVAIVTLVEVIVLTLIVIGLAFHREKMCVCVRVLKRSLVCLPTHPNPMTHSWKIETTTITYSKRDWKITFFSFFFFFSFFPWWPSLSRFSPTHSMPLLCVCVVITE